MGKLLLYGDFRELPIVKELVEENDYRVPLTKEKKKKKNLTKKKKKKKKQKTSIKKRGKNCKKI